jgi:hypothetical protein
VTIKRYKAIEDTYGDLDVVLYSDHLAAVAQMREALTAIVAMGGMRLLGGRELEPDRAHQLVDYKAKAFEQVVEIARDALAQCDEGDGR